MKKQKIMSLLIALAVLFSSPAHAVLNSTDTRVQYTCNGTTTTYAYGFKILEDDDLNITTDDGSTETTLVLNTDYTVTGAGNDGGGNVVLTTGSKCSSTETLTILRDVDLTQDTDYVDGEYFTADSLEIPPDKLMMISQQQQEQLDRAILLRKSSTLSNIDLPNPSGGYAIGWNANGDGLANISSSSLTVTQKEYVHSDETLAQAVTRIGSTKTTLLIDRTLTITDGTTVTIPSTLALEPTRSGLIQGVAGGGTETLTINGQIIAGPWQIFGDNLTVNGNPQTSFYVMPQWFGAVTDGTTDCLSAINNALSLLKTGNGGVLFFPAGEDSYLITGTIDLTDANSLNIRLLGESSFGSSSTRPSTFIEFNSVSPGAVMIDVGDASTDQKVNGVQIENITLFGNDVATIGIKAYGFLKNSSIKNVTIKNTAYSDIWLQSSWGASIDDVYSEGSVHSAVLIGGDNTGSSSSYQVNALTFNNFHSKSTSEEAIIISGSGTALTFNNLIVDTVATGGADNGFSVAPYTTPAGVTGVPSAITYNCNIKSVTLNNPYFENLGDLANQYFIYAEQSTVADVDLNIFGGNISITGTGTGNVAVKVNGARALNVAGIHFGNDGAAGDYFIASDASDNYIGPIGYSGVPNTDYFDFTSAGSYIAYDPGSARIEVSNFSLADGTDTAPSLTFQSDTGRGLRYDSGTGRPTFETETVGMAVNSTATEDSGNWIFGAIGPNKYAVAMYSVSGTGNNAADTAMNVRKDSNTNRSINAAGTINASGADYAEYERKGKQFDSASAGPGSIVGFDANGELTTVFRSAISFGIISTMPNLVGGDTWGSEEELGAKRPDAPGKKATKADKEKYKKDLGIFRKKLKDAEESVALVAYCGKVPFNGTGEVGDWIIPAEAPGGGIGYYAVKNASADQVVMAVGRIRSVGDETIVSVKPPM